MNAVVEVKGPQLPEPVARRGITEAQWRTLMNNLYPGATSDSVLMVWDYCAARHLDPLKKPCHIVPMQVRNARSGDYEWRDVVMPGIYEYRTTAMRTGLYLGHSKPEYGPDVEHLGATVPEWCELTVYRWNAEAKQKIEFPVRVWFRECAATRKDKKTGAIGLNDRWSKAPRQMLTKCAEAAGLREGFPDELGGSSTAEEMEGRVIDVTPAIHPDAERYANAIADILAQEGGDDGELHADAIFDIHLQICTDDALYGDVQDLLKARGILTAKQLKDTVAFGSKRFQERRAEAAAEGRH